MTYGREDINSILRHLEEVRSPVPLDGSPEWNRRYAKLLLDWARKAYEGIDPVAVINRLVDIAMSDDFHNRNLTSMAYIHKHKAKIILIGVERKAKATANSSGYRIVRPK